jgi:hypothetical protein
VFFRVMMTTEERAYVDGVITRGGWSQRDAVMYGFQLIDRRLRKEGR